MQNFHLCHGQQKKRNEINFFPIPRLDPILTIKKVAVGIFEFARCVDWGFHKKLNPKKKTAEPVTFFLAKVPFCLDLARCVRRRAVN
jgi:hypothetical protein